MEDAQPRRKVAVDLEELRFAMEDASYDHRYFLDTETGEVILVSELLDDDDPRQQLSDISEAEPGRYLEVPRADPREGYADMQDFIDRVSDERLHELLDVATVKTNAEAHLAFSRTCWHATPLGNSIGSIFRRRAWRHAPVSGWLKKVVNLRLAQVGATGALLPLLAARTERVC